ncbi:BQ2448_1461 [Microbotryum intermedium]|uniref:BQ2448_1461 protein n=1 Tax=Microbotryum intermedium TaxID=269621 RepID=A0A238FA65_9BASI|nr:BQ2448_1461 [Microbotryum intermedium]
MPISARRNVRSTPAPLKVPAILPPNLAPATPPFSGNSLLSPSLASTANHARRSTSDCDLPTPLTSDGSASHVCPSAARSASARGASPANAGLPPLPRKSLSNNAFELNREDREEANCRKKMLMPRSAVVNKRCLDLDFGFLDEEPPLWTYSERRRSSLSCLESAPIYERNRSSGVNYFQTTKRREPYASNGPPGIDASRSPVGVSFYSTVSKSSERPFPSKRPSIARAFSSESSFSPRHERFLSREALNASSAGPEHRRPSAISYTSLESNTSSDFSSSGMGGQRYTSSNSEADISPTQNLGVGSNGVHDELHEGEATDQRKRLATFLDQAASAMEGGRSLRQVLPETAPARAGQAPAKSLSQLAEISASSPLPAPDARLSLVFKDDCPELRYVQDRFGTGLGLHTVTQQRENSPVLLQAPSPSAPAPPVTQKGACLSGVTLDGTPQTDADEYSSPDVRDRNTAQAKMAENRRRTIQELIQTEQSYAIDMMVVRDIYLARARGFDSLTLLGFGLADFNLIADHVMASGLGLSASASPSSPAVRSGFNSLTLSARSEARRLTMSSLNMNSLNGATQKGGRRISSAPTLSAKLEQRRATKARLSSASGLVAPGIPVMSTKDLHVIFANLEEVSGLAERFAHMLSQAKGATDIPQIQKVYSTYCARHHRAIVRLQELEPTLRTYLAECKTLSHGHTKAWDLTSLLIKPVQRCLKYPLLLHQILAVTPESHPDRHDLVRANSEMLLVAETINKAKSRQEVPGPQGRLSVASIASPRKDPMLRRESKSSLSSAMTKKFLRSSSKTSTAQVSNERSAERDDMFDTLAALVDSTRSSVLRFSSEMREWSKGTKAQLEAQVVIVEGWIDLYAPLSEEPDAQDSLCHRLMVFLEEVLDPVIDGSYREAHEVRRSLLLKSDHLLSLFESPRQFIQKRNDKMLDHSRYLAKKLPADRRESDEFLELSARLLEELPRFLASVSKYYDIIIGHFSGAQEAYQEEVQERWDVFAERFRLRDEQGMMGNQQILANELMHRLAVGLGLSVPSLVPRPGSTSGKFGKRHLRHATSSSGNSTSLVSIRRQSIIASGVPRPTSNMLISNSGGGANNIRSRLQEYQFTAGSQNEPPVIANRSSITSEASTPSFTVSCKSGESSNGGPATPPPSTMTQNVRSGEDHYGKQRQHMHQGSSNQLSSFGVVLPSTTTSRNLQGGVAPLPWSTPEVGLHSPLETPSFRGRSGSGDDASAGSSITATRPTGSPKYRYETEPEDYYFEKDRTLYVAEAMEDSSTKQYLGVEQMRGDFPILVFREEGGCGWLLGRKHGDGVLGWVRTEMFTMLEDDER